MNKPLALLSLVLSTHLSLPVLAADWPMFQYDARRQGAVPDRPEITRPGIRWRVPVGISSWLNNPVIADNTVFIGSAGQFWNEPDSLDFSAKRPTDGVMAFDLASGRLKWHAPAQQDVNQVAWDAGLVLATGDEGVVWALDARNGKERWRTRLNGSAYQLLVQGDQVIVGDSTGQLYWLDRSSGKIRRQQQLRGAIRAGAASDGQLVIVPTTAGQIYAFDLQGKQRWQADLNAVYAELNSDDYRPTLEIYNVPTLYQDLVILGFARDTTYAEPALVALERSSGKLRWKGQSMGQRADWGNLRSSPALYQDLLVYAEPYANDIVAIQAETGQATGSKAAGLVMFPQWSSPAVAGKTVYVPRFDGGLYALNASNGQLRWQFYLGQAELAGPRFPEALRYAGEGGEWKPPVGDAIYSSPALAANGDILLAAGGYLYCLTQIADRP